MRRIGIIGAGIGGLTLANALARHGIDAMVFERASELNEVGAGLSLPSNAMQVFERLGLDKAIIEHATAIDTIELSSHRGTMLRRVDLTGFRQRFGHAAQAIHRARLQELLAAAIGRDKVQFGMELIDIDEAAEEIVARFSDGTEVPMDLLVGADGLRSTVRGQLFPDVALRDSGQIAFRGIGALTLTREVAATGREIWGVSRRFGFSQIGADGVYWYASLNQPCDVAADRAKPILQDLYASFPVPVAKIIAATPAHALIKTELHDFAPMHGWHRGRAALIGDAAHATTPNLGQGGAQAVESAFVLARCIVGQEDHEQAFAAYQAQRMRKAHHVTNRSWQLGKAAQLKNPLLRFVRDLAVRAIPLALHRKQLEKLFALGP